MGRISAVRISDGLANCGPKIIRLVRIGVRTTLSKPWQNPYSELRGLGDVVRGSQYLFFWKWLLLLLLLFYSCLLVISWKTSGNSRSQPQIKAIHRGTLRMMCAMLTSAMFCNCMADGWPGSSWRFWSVTFLFFPNVSIKTGTLFVLVTFCWPRFPGLCNC